MAAKIVTYGKLSSRSLGRLPLQQLDDCHPIANKVKENETLDRVNEYVSELTTNQKKYDSRELLYGINSWLIAGVVFLLCWVLFDWKWYWSLISGIVMLAVAFKIAPITNLRQKSRIKAILLERDLIKTTKEAAGFTEVIDFHKIREKNNYVFIGSIIGGVLGCLGGPLGMIGGLIIGGLIGHFIKNYKDVDDTNWEEISIGSGWMAKGLCGLLSIGILWLAAYAIFFDHTQSENQTIPEITEETIEETVKTMEGNENASAADIVGKEAVADLFSFYYPASSDIFNEYGIREDGKKLYVYTDNLKAKFEELGISKSLKDNEVYTSAYNNVMQKIKAEEDRTGSLILDADILVNGQEAFGLDLNVKNINVKDENNVEIIADLTNCNNVYSRTYILKKENGRFKIDDIIDDGESVMNGLKSFLNSSNKTPSGMKSHYMTLQFSGKIGNSPIICELNIQDGKINGRYAYKSTLNKYGDRPESYFTLSGNIDGSDNVKLASKMHNTNSTFEYITIPVSELYAGSSIEGELINANTRDKYSFELQPE